MCSSLPYVCQPWWAILSQKPLIFSHLCQQKMPWVHYCLCGANFCLRSHQKINFHKILAAGHLGFIFSVFFVCNYHDTLSYMLKGSNNDLITQFGISQKLEEI